ncbi:MAG: RNA 3'-terminal phosphate cyclase [Candidatus Micrarchaeota archaeon]
MQDIIEIDGSEGEGGGQVIRTALTLSSITGKPFKIINIRAKRPNPGLQPQHLMAAKAVRNVCRGTLIGAELGSKELSFTPGEIIGGKYDFNIGTAGSVTLVAQSVIPILLFAKKESIIKIIGGTHVMKSPSYDYFEEIFIKAIKEFGVEIETKLFRSGYYPKGGGEIEIKIKPSTLAGRTRWFNNEQTKVIIRVGSLPEVIAIREKKIFMENEISYVKIIQEQTPSPGNAVTACSGFRGAYVLGERGKKSEEVGQEAYENLMKETGSDVDLHLADQLLIYGALASESTSYKTSEITEHTKTNIEIIKKFLDKKIEVIDNQIEIF